MLLYEAAHVCTEPYSIYNRPQSPPRLRCREERERERKPLSNGAQAIGELSHCCESGRAVQFIVVALFKTVLPFSVVYTLYTHTHTSVRYILPILFFFLGHVLVFLYSEVCNLYKFR